MSQIDELHSRITRAFDRISTGVEALGSAQPGGAEGGPAEIAALRGALDEERMANAQLEERLRQLHAQLENPQNRPAGGAAQAEQRQAMAALDGELQRLRQANDMLMRSQAEMRAALEAGLGEPHLINQAMLAELESLRAARGVETAEARALLAGLTAALTPEAL
ncbi:hypothetical protein [Salipiger mangrovisoli]|uniref:Uncharacterized protein n=1 Tax=Salipiger mangrovisoli TaxID=2865933 RepID=A0ABR9X3H7_9RHOB|nr:hypothetical protein [Salipiger mangrovisoli]MBE9638069.1 hypothetical protein [Salipiger mangrovisoli]